ncbi:hypothetical protein AVEN_248578-1 [Araneus ventricosus]|uniref:Uncharacterized protein n=1 Tax=Araneus ventricosus TaxID=182803 RepID=A0A4Y2I175_ARAVE|nr:hypothetical protein AVEN_248578-1 [Araneus ventricosus]
MVETTIPISQITLPKSQVFFLFIHLREGSLGEYGCPNPEVPRVLFLSRVYSLLRLLLFANDFHPSTASEGALHEKQLPLCLLLVSYGQPKTPLLGRA